MPQTPTRIVLTILATLCTSIALAQVPAQTPLTVYGDHFLLNNKPFQILSGELEYARIPRELWRDRLRKVRALGLNSITVYIFWNLHETTPGTYDFTGQNDVAEYIREAQQEGLYVILRPGPYVCAEWDLGGYPAWLLKDPQMLLRSAQPAYLTSASRWLRRLGQELAPLQASRGGPILAVQIENEYGSFRIDPKQEDRTAYLAESRQMLLDAGFGESLLYTADGGDELPQGSIPGILAAVDFGTGDEARSVALLQKFRPTAPVFIAEYWDGWFDHFGAAHEVTDAATQQAEIRTAIQKGWSISLYMVHGGTTWGWHNGANSDGGGYQPDVSSYDYDAPIDEAGRPRPKYFALRSMIAAETHQILPEVPASAPTITIPPLTLTQSRPLLASLHAPVEFHSPLTFEAMDQSFGLALYRTNIPSAGTHLHVEGLHSYAHVYLDGKFVGVLDRRLKQSDLTISAKPGQTLDLLVENTGRVNFTTLLRKERAGILGPVTLDSIPLTGWDNYSVPLNHPPTEGFYRQHCTGPCFFNGTFTVPTPGDTFLDTTQLGRGVLWVNGHLLGRFWSIGPMGSLYLPGVWLRPGLNKITVFNWNGGTELHLSGSPNPIYITPSK